MDRIGEDADGGAVVSAVEVQAGLSVAPGVAPVAALTAPVPDVSEDDGRRDLAATPAVVRAEGSADALARDVLSPVMADAGAPAPSATVRTDTSVQPQSAELLAVSSPVGEAHDRDTSATPMDGALPANAASSDVLRHADRAPDTSPPGPADATKPVQQHWHWAKRMRPLPRRRSKGAKPPRPPTVPYFRLYRFATTFDLLMLVVGVIAGIGMGAVQPLSLLFFGDIINAFSPTATGDELLSAVRTAAINLSILAGVAFVCGWAEVTIFTTTGLRQANRIRELYFQAILRQEVGWYDAISTGELTARIAGNINEIQAGISEKAGIVVRYVAMFITAIVIGFVFSWQLSLVVLAVVPLVALAGAAMGRVISTYSQLGQEAYGKAGGVADEVLSSIRTVVAFGGEDRAAGLYRDRLQAALITGIKRAHYAGLGIGVTFFILFSTYALAFWYGSVLINQGEISAGRILTVFFAIIFSAIGLGQASPSFAAFANASGAAYTVFQTIDRVPVIDSLSTTGDRPPDIRGEICFDNVHFRYPTRPDLAVLNGLSFTIPAGKQLALVGPSGCGKSTVVGLLLRFYDPASGRITIDGVDIRMLNVPYLRSLMGVVDQNVELFNEKIADNIALGVPTATRSDVEAAARAANAHDFISRLSRGYDTIAGERGAQLSGGQKQRIAIARALLRSPRILLLDEATSALDTQSERLVQQTLNSVGTGRTRLTIAHRLSTVQTADIIAVVHQGRIVEQGTHHELMERADGVYAHMVQLQAMRATETGETTAAAPATLVVDSEAEAEVTRGPRQEAATPAGDGARLKPPTPEAVVEEADAGAKGKDGADDAQPPMDDALADPPLNFKGITRRMYKVNAPEKRYIAAGVFGAALNGVVFPIYAIVLANVINDLLSLRGDDLTNAVRKWSLIFMALATAMFVANYLQQAMLGTSSELLTNRLRGRMFRAMLRQNVGWFDHPSHSTGALGVQLAEDAARAPGITGANLGSITQLVSTIIAGLIVAFTGSWQVAFVVLGAVPLAGLGGAMNYKLLVGFNERTRTAYEQSGRIASEAVGNVRTVNALGLHSYFITTYLDSLREPTRTSMKGAMFSGLAFGFSQAVITGIWAMSFYFGATLVVQGQTTFNAVMRSIAAILLSGIIIGQSTQLAPDIGKARIAAAAIFRLLDRAPLIDSSSGAGQGVDHIDGRLDADSLEFAYPARPKQQILRGLSFHLPARRSLAIVGPSGCGKSTIVALLERYYDPISGTLTADNMDIRTLQLGGWRQQMGLVQQFPVLFGTATVLENIRYGKPTATLDEVEAAARQANVHEFIMSLPAGYDTDVGEHGGQLSGGQKQRIAIARALVRDPPILLLDEATSALDSESERLVQAALEHAQRGRTSVTIAHRLSTIANADQIVFVDNGTIVEAGSHNELMMLHGRYYDAVQNQIVAPS